MIASSSSPYFPDPYPVYRAGGDTSVPDPHVVFGTKPAMLTCPGRIEPGCYTSHPITIQLDRSITDQLHAAGTTAVTTFNHNPFRDSSGHWQMALTATVRPAASDPKHSDSWSVVLHAHPADAASPAPTAWTADAVLVGSLAHDARANYDGKYFEDHGVLYLLYSRRLSDDPAHDGVVAQRMTTATTPARSVPVVLLAPKTGAGFTSERFAENKPKDRFKLVETGNVTKVGDHYVMAYSTGAFDESDYKTGIAWSNTFLPSAGTTYRKVVVPDAGNVWHNPSGHDVRYLLQSQKPDWPDYVGSTVQAPGVPSLVEDGGHWFVIFAGYRGGTARAPFDPAHRQPFLAPIPAPTSPTAGVTRVPASNVPTPGRS